MSDEHRPPMLELHITVDERGAVHLHGPLEHHLLVLGALEAAKQVLEDYRRRKAEEAARARARAPRVEVAGAGWRPGG